MMHGRFVLALSLLAPSLTAQEAPPRPDPASPSELGTDGLAGGLDKAALDGESRAHLEDALRTRDYDQAEALLLEAVERAPRSPELLRLLGSVRFLSGKALGAAVALKKAEAIAPLDERSRFTLAMSYVAMGRRAWARPELRTLTQAAPKNTLYLYWTARLDYDDGQYAAAVEGLKRTIEIEPGFMKAHDNLGLAYEALGRSDEAIASYESALRLSRASISRSPWPALNLGLLFARQGRLDEAEALFRESLRADPAFPQGHYQLGTVLEKKGRYDEAKAELEEAARRDTTYPEPQYALARIHRRLGEAEKAHDALELFQKLKNEKAKAASGSR
jgi:tetratricopeptide (TPR) repeat protein